MANVPKLFFDKSDKKFLLVICVIFLLETNFKNKRLSNIKVILNKYFFTKLVAFMPKMVIKFKFIRYKFLNNGCR